jgi:hypothetical protein
VLVNSSVPDRLRPGVPVRFEADQRPMHLSRIIGPVDPAQVALDWIA